MNEVIAFLLPQLGDPIQAIFFATILLMMAYTIGGAHYAARPSQWEKKWNRGTETTEDDLDIDHGSVTDLWHAVATSHEKLAEIMPGLLLVVGLLGTFLGLGMALNHASNILGQQDAMSASGAANSMADLMSMMKGLGTKFKTSTWGICGFVLLKIWSELTRFEEKRLVWVIDKVKKELRSRREKEEEAENSKKNALFNEIRMAASGIENAFKSAIEASIQSNHDGISKLNSSLNAIDLSSRETSMALLNEIRMAGSGIENTVKSSIEASTQSNHDGISKLNSSLNAIHSSSKETSTAMAAFTESTASIVQKMAVAGEGMASGADKVSVAAQGLTSAVDGFSAKFTGVLDSVSERLGSAIEDMSDKSAETMRSGSEKLGAATDKISESLTSLSGDIKKTLGEVQGSIETSLDIQKRAFSLFDTTSTTLAEMIQKSTQTVNTMKESIESGLGSVGNASLRVGKLVEPMEGVSKRVGDLVNSMERFSENSSSVVVKLEEVSKNVNSLVEPFSQVSNRIGDLVKKIDIVPNNLSDISGEIRIISNNVSELVRKIDKDSGISPGKFSELHGES
jgi:archaellum component FlaC